MARATTASLRHTRLSVVALNAKNGLPISNFGVEGMSISEGLDRAVVLNGNELRRHFAPVTFANRRRGRRFAQGRRRAGRPS